MNNKITVVAAISALGACLASGGFSARADDAAHVMLTRMAAQFDIMTDDKEHQDGVKIEVYDKNGTQVGYCESPPQNHDGEGADHNLWYWPSFGPGVEHHFLFITFAHSIPIADITSFDLKVRSGYTNQGSDGRNDFKSWNANVSAYAQGSDGKMYSILGPQYIPFHDGNTGDSQYDNPYDFKFVAATPRTSSAIDKCYTGGH
jgi:hypothetical protein